MRYLLLITFLLSLVSLSVYAELLEADKNLNSLTTIKERGRLLRKLKYQGKHGNFLVFYDYAGDVMYLQYRIDKYDLTHQRTVSFLQRGATYIVQFEFFGAALRKPAGDIMNVKQRMRDLTKTRADTAAYAIRGERRVYIGSYQGYRSGVIERLRY